MKKHFTGIALFIFIVGISAFVASMFIEIPKAEVFEISETVPQYTSKKKCTKNSRKFQSNLFKVKVEQIIYNEKTEKLYTNFLIERDVDDSAEKLEIDLHFFVQEPHGSPRFLYTERVLIKSEFKGDVVFYNSSSIKFIERLNAFKSLYVIAEPKTESERKSDLGGIKNIPTFNYKKAVEVLIQQK